MKRDLDLVRAILLALEAHPHGFAPPDFTVAGYAEDTIGYHVWLMAEGQLLTAAEEVTAFETGSPIAIPRALTWQGHEFLDTVRHEKVWRQVKAELKDRAISLPFPQLMEFAIQVAKALAGLD